MKRTFLLTLALCMLSTLSFAQSEMVLERVAPMTKSSLKGLVKPSITTAQTRPRRSVADGVYYTHERGVMYSGYTFDGRGYRGTLLNYPPFQNVIFLNKSGSLDINWSINGNDYTEDMDSKTGDFLYVSLPKTTLTEEGLSSFYTPTLTKGKSSYTYLDTNYRGEVNQDGSSIIVTNSPDWDLSYTFSDYATNILYGGGWVDSYTGTEDDTYIFGSGTVTFSDIGTTKSFAVSQCFPAPISPFIANNISIHTMSVTKPIAEGKKLFMEIRDVETLEDGSLTFGDEVYETLEATADDVELAWTYSDGDNVYNVHFYKKEVDDFGIEANAPFVLDKDFCVVIGGLSDEGIDCGFMGLTAVTEDLDYLQSAEPLIETQDGKIYSFNYGIPMTLPCNFWGFFDAVEVPTILYASDDTAFEDCNILRVSDDGKIVSNEKYPEIFDSNVYVIVARDWEDADGNENYYFDAPEWISDITIYETESSEETGMYLVTILAEPLPEGVTGRTGQMYLKGIGGLTSADPIIVLQGDATVDGIQEVSTKKVANTQRYNLNGMRMNGNVKGIVIENGRKYIQK